MPHTGTEYRGYVIERTLGRGGHATVFQARRPGDPGPVALKVLHPDQRDRAQLVRLRREFRLARQVRHRHSVRVHELGPCWLSMELVSGGTIADLPAARQLEALAQIGAALDHAHVLGVVHCDVKPPNILVHRDFDDRGAVLIDYGVAHSLAEDMAVRLAQDATHRMTLHPARQITARPPERPALVQASLPYAAPEVLLGHIPSATTDVYSLACTATELLTGTPPFPAATVDDLVQAHLHTAAPRVSQRRAGLPRGIDGVLGRALAKDPGLRYPNCSAFLTALTVALR